MSSKYQMWLTHNGESDKLRFPVLPASISVSNGSKNTSIDIAGLGEIVIKQDRPAYTISFQSFFPAALFPGAQHGLYSTPAALADSIVQWKNSDKPVHFLITGTYINMYCTIENFTWTENGGDVGSIHYSISLKEYREVAARQVIFVDGTATLSGSTETRVDNREEQELCTVETGDCLYNFAKEYLGDGERSTEIYDMNQDLIMHPCILEPATTLRLPDA